MSAAAKAAQRKRRKAGLEEVRALVNMPKLVAWLTWDGRLKEEDARNPAAIRKALEDFLREQYVLMAEEPSAPEYNFRFACGSFGAEFTTLRDRPKEVVGLLQREGEYDWRDPPTRQLITRRSAALRKAVPPPESDLKLAASPLGGWMGDDLGDIGQPSARLPVEPTKGWPPPYQVPQYDYAEEALEPPPDDYDPESDVEGESLDLSDDALKECLDVDGYEEG
jgi:hypothetical protein